MNSTARLDLSNKTPRRIGIPRPRATPNISPPIPKTRNEMPPRKKARPPAAASRNTPEDDIERPPEEQDTTDDEAVKKRTAIPPTIFQTREDMPATVNGARTQGQEKAHGPNGIPPNGLGIVPGKQQGSQSSQHRSGTNSPAKRKNEETGANKLDAFGNYAKRKKQSSQSTYGKNAKPIHSSASTKINSSAKSKADTSNSPRRQFAPPDDVSDSEGSQKSDKENEGKQAGSDSDIPTSGSKTKKGFRKPIELPASPVRNDETPIPKFKPPGEWDEDELGLSSVDKSSRTKLKPKSKIGKRAKEEPPLTQMPKFNPIGGLDDPDHLDRDVDELAGNDEALFSDDDFKLPVFKRPASDIEDTPSGSQQPRCPFCKQEVDAAVLKQFEGMSTREQEKFCQTHQKEDAKREWDKLGYPKINWTKLDTRINKHHKHVKKLINGMDSHYRAEFQAKVDAGQDRNLRQATANLTPGYYGGRGLRALSENIMNAHTKLFKKRAPLDTLISARGVTAFVQSVLVPEVAALLIKEDMRIPLDEARTLLADSARIGELVHEEIREVVKRRIEDEVDDSDDFSD